MKNCGEYFLQSFLEIVKGGTKHRDSPTFKMHNIGTDPAFEMHNVGIVPSFKMHKKCSKTNRYLDLVFFKMGEVSR